MMLEIVSPSWTFRVMGLSMRLNLNIEFINLTYKNLLSDYNFNNIKLNKLSKNLKELF